MMDLYEFNLLPLKEKAQYTWTHGNFLVTRHESYYAINLYHVDKFFVEVWYHPELVCIDKIRSFKSKICLEPYFDEIEIDF